MLTRETFIGPWAGLPVAWKGDDLFDEQTYRADVSRCCAARVFGVYTGGTTGEFYAMEFDEFKAVARATVEECRAHGKPVMIGCSSTYTLGAARRAAFAAELGADAIQVALPFWIEVGDAQLVPFFREVASTAKGLPLSIYETKRAKKLLTVDQHRSIKEAVPEYLMLKAIDGTIGATPEGCRTLSEFVNVFVAEAKWAELGPVGAVGVCSAAVYWNSKVVLSMWEQLQEKNWTGLKESCRMMDALIEFLVSEFAPKGFPDGAYDRLGGRATGFLKTSLHGRGPYPYANNDEVAVFRRWCQDHYPALLEL